jgi:hypothetical protein
MGTSTVQAVLMAGWAGRVNQRAFAALVQMAMMSLDRDHPPRYWGGWYALVPAVGLRVPQECERGGPCEQCATARRVVKRAVTCLVEGGAIERLGHSAPGRNAEYALILRPAPSSLTVTTERVSLNGHRSPNRGHPLSPKQGTPAVPLFVRTGDRIGIEQGTTVVPPRSIRRRTTQEQTQEERTALQASTSLGVVVEEPNTTQCDDCRWMTWEGHAPGCRRGAQHRLDRNGVPRTDSGSV